MIIVPPPSGQRRKPDPKQVQEAAASAGLVLPDMAVQAFQQGRVIEAIKLIRTANPGLDLARAKAVMERMQAQALSGATDKDAGVIRTSKASMPPSPRWQPTVEMGDKPGQLRWLLLVVALVVAGVWFGFAGGL